MVRMLGMVLAVVFGSGLVPHATPTAEAAEKARSNLASGDLTLLEQAFGSGGSRVKAKRTGKGGPPGKKPGGWNKTQELRTGKTTPTDHKFETPKRRRVVK